MSLLIRQYVFMHEKLDLILFELWKALYFRLQVVTVLSTVIIIRHGRINVVHQLRQQNLESLLMN